MPTLKVFLEDQRGASSIEYALLATFIAIAIVASLGVIATKIEDPLNNVQAGL